MWFGIGDQTNPRLSNLHYYCERIRRATPKTLRLIHTTGIQTLGNVDVLRERQTATLAQFQLCIYINLWLPSLHWKIQCSVLGAKEITAMPPPGSMWGGIAQILSYCLCRPMKWSRWRSSWRRQKQSTKRRPNVAREQPHWQVAAPKWLIRRKDRRFYTALFIFGSSRLHLIALSLACTGNGCVEAETTRRAKGVWNINLFVEMPLPRYLEMVNWTTMDVKGF